MAQLTHSLRVLHVRPRLGVGGATEYLVRLAESQAAAGHRVIVAAGGGDWGARVRPFARYYDDVQLVPRVGPGRNLPNLPALFVAALKLTRIVRAEGVQVINAHHRFAAMAAKVVARLTGVPLVVTLHELPWKNRGLTRLTLDGWTVTLSRLMQRFVVEGCGIPGERVAVIPIGIDIPAPLSPARRTRLLGELGLDGAGPIVGCVGRLVGRKGQIHLVRAFPDVLHHHPAARLLLVGEGDQRATLEQATRELGVAEQVVFAGARDDALELMQLCAFTAVPSLEEEFGIVITEAFACGRAVVATEVGGIPEHVRPEENGLLVRAADSAALAAGMLRLLDAPALAERLGRAGLRAVEQQYTRQRFLERTDAVYRAAIAARREAA